MTNKLYIGIIGDRDHILVIESFSSLQIFWDLMLFIWQLIVHWILYIYLINLTFSIILPLNLLNLINIIGVNRKSDSSWRWVQRIQVDAVTQRLSTLTSPTPTRTLLSSKRRRIQLASLRTLPLVPPSSSSSPVMEMSEKMLALPIPSPVRCLLFI